MNVKEFMQDVKERHQDVEWDWSGQMADIIAMSEWYKLVNDEERMSHYVVGYIIDRLGNDHGYPIVYRVFCEEDCSENASVTERFELTDGKDAAERVVRFAKRLAADGFERGGRACERVCAYEPSYLTRSAGVSINAYAKAAHDVIGSDCGDLGSAAMRLSVAADLVEHLAEYLRTAAAAAVEDVAGFSRDYDYNYEFDVDCETDALVRM